MYRVCFFLLLLVFSFVPLYATNGMFPTFMGVQGAGRGGVDFGIASDSTCLNTNPAGIGFIHGKTTEFSTGFFFPTISFSNVANNTDSDFEPVPMAMFSMVFDSPFQIGEAISDPFVYAFGGQPLNTDYVFFSGGQPFSVNSHSKNRGEGMLEMEIRNTPLNLSLLLQGNKAKVSDIRVYGHLSSVETKQQTFFSCSQHPSIPQGAKVCSISVHFRWKFTKECHQAQVALVAENQQEVLLLKGKQGVWKEGYLALAWEKETLPATIYFFCLTENAPVKIEAIEVKSAYKIEEEYFWQILPVSNSIPKQDSYFLLFSDQKEYCLENSFKIPLPLKEKNNLKKISVYYSYVLDSKEKGRSLEVSLISEKKKICTGRHVMAYRSPEQKAIPICRRNADQETRSLDRSPGWKWGLGLFPQAGARYSISIIDTELFPEGIENRTDLILASLVPGVAYRFSENFSIGVALNFHFLNVELDGLISQESTILQGKPIQGTDVTFGEYLIGVVGENNVRGEMDTNYLLGFGIGTRIGFLWKISDRLQFGAMYSPPGWMMDAKGTANLDFNRHFEKIGVANIAKIVLPDQGQYGFSGKYDVELEFELPQRLGFGFSWRFLDNALVGLDFQWINYSETQFELKAKMRNGSNRDLNALTGSQNVNPTLKIGWKDQYVIALGFVWQPTPYWTLRTGYNYGNNPIPKKYLNPQLAAITEHHITLGTTYLINRYLSLHFAMEFSLPSKISSNENLVHKAYENSELKIFNIATILGMSLRF